MESSVLTVFFDGGCPLCRREIDHYRKLTPRSPILWVDVTCSEDVLNQHRLDRITAMQQFHVLDKSGSFHVGAEGFLTLWAELPYYRGLSASVRWLHLGPLLAWGYKHFANWHFNRRCADGVCGVPKVGSPR